MKNKHRLLLAPLLIIAISISVYSFFYYRNHNGLASYSYVDCTGRTQIVELQPNATYPGFPCTTSDLKFISYNHAWKWFYGSLVFLGLVLVITIIENNKKPV